MVKIGDTIEIIVDTFESEEIDGGTIYEIVDSETVKVHLISDAEIDCLIKKDSFGRWVAIENID